MFPFSYIIAFSMRHSFCVWLSSSRVQSAKVAQQRKKQQIEQALTRRQKLAGDWFNPYHTSTFNSDGESMVGLTHDEGYLSYPEQKALGKALSRMSVNNGDGRADESF
jgi:hypothetical protein